MKVNMSGEELLMQKMLEGWNISIECKGAGREYGMSFEGSAYKVGSPMHERAAQYISHHAVGDTIKELLKNMFKEYKG